MQRCLLRHSGLASLARDGSVKISSISHVDSVSRHVQRKRGLRVVSHSARQIITPLITVHAGHTREARDLHGPSQVAQGELSGCERWSNLISLSVCLCWGGKRSPTMRQIKDSCSRWLYAYVQVEMEARGHDKVLRFAHSRHRKQRRLPNPLGLPKTMNALLSLHLTVAFFEHLHIFTLATWFRSVCLSVCLSVSISLSLSLSLSLSDFHV